MKIGMADPVLTVLRARKLSFSLTIHGVLVVLRSIRFHESPEGPSSAHSDYSLRRSSATCLDVNIRFHQRYFVDKPSILRIQVENAT